VIKFDGIDDFFKMTRRERRGTIVVLAALALVMAGSVVTRSCGNATVDAERLEMLEFESDVDSTAAVATKPKKNKRATGSKTRRRRSPSTAPKPAKPPRSIDPVPQF